MFRVKKRTPAGRVVTRTKKRRTSFAKCANCGRQLHGVPRLSQVEIGKLAKSERKPNRPYGGYYCSECMRELFRGKVRSV